MPLSEDEVSTVCKKLLNTAPDNIEFPGGKSRESVRATIGEHRVIVTRRKHQERARLESVVLRALNKHNAPVPRLIAASERYLIQQDVGNYRLSEALVSADEEQARQLLQSALHSLESIYTASKHEPILQSIVVLGNKESWIKSLIESATRVGKILDSAPPSLDTTAFTSMLTVSVPHFIKWDARPGNAVVRDSGYVVWIDWEHCGLRHPLDDLAWLLNDEYTPFYPQVYESLLNKALGVFGQGLSPEQALDYYSAFATFHSCIRLELILKYQARKGWWDFDYCLKFDKVGVVKRLATALSRRAAWISKHSKHTAPLAPWFAEITASIEELS